MMKFVLMITCLSCYSCSAFKHSEVKHFPVKTVDENAKSPIRYIEYYSTTGEDENCFKSNPKGKEIITVKDYNLEAAIDYFYKRIWKVNIFKSSGRNSNPYGNLNNFKYKITEINPPIEVADCYIGLRGGFHGEESWGLFYTSFREKN